MKLPLDDNGDLIPYHVRLKSPRNLIIMSMRKSGKTDSMIDNPNFLIGDCEKGTEYFEGSNKVNLLTYNESDKAGPFTRLKNNNIIPTGLFQTVMELQEENNMKLFRTLEKQYEASPTEQNFNELMKCILLMKFPIFVIDTITSFMKMVESCALFEYNLNLNPTTKKKTNIKKVDNYNGAKYIRNTLEELKGFIETAAPFIVYNAHTKLRKASLEKHDEEMTTVDIDLEGSLPGIFSSRADALGFLYRDEEGVWLDFKKREESDLDARPRHLMGKLFKIADLHELDTAGDLVKKGETHWKELYPELIW